MISNSDPRWVWELDPKRPWGELTTYRGNRQVTNLALTQFTNAGALPTNDGTNQIYERVLDPLSSGEFVYRNQLRYDRAAGSGWSAGTWRSEISNTNMEPVWGTEYWSVCAVLLSDDFAASTPSINIWEYHVPSPNVTPVGISPVTMFAGPTFSFSIRYNASLPSGANDYTTGATWSATATRNVWHYFVMNFKLGADSASNFFKLWHKEGDGALNQVVNYTGRIGYDAATSARYNYAKHGMYAWSWNGSNPTRTMHSKGFRIITAAAGTPTIDENEMLALMYTSDVEPPPPDYVPWSGVVIPALTKFTLSQNGSSEDNFAVFAGTPNETDKTGGNFDPTEIRGNEMLIKQNESTAANRTFYVQLTKTADDTAYTTALSAGDLKISKAGGAEANTDGVATHLGGGCYKYVATATEVDTIGAGYVRIAQATCYGRMYPFQVVAFDPASATNLGLSNVDTTVSSRLATASYQDVDDILDAADSIETGVTIRGMFRLLLAALAGKISGGGTTTITIRNAVADSKARITATVDSSGNRTAITTDQT
jgi:hypothetical protein